MDTNHGTEGQTSPLTEPTDERDRDEALATCKASLTAFRS